MGVSRSVDAFILKTLAAGGSVPSRNDTEPKRVPGTPVKKVKTAHLVGGVQRPWQSAVAHKIGFKDFDDGSVGNGKGKARPRPSLPAAFPGLGSMGNLGKAKENKTAKKPISSGREAEVVWVKPRQWIRTQHCELLTSQVSRRMGVTVVVERPTRWPDTPKN